MRTFKHSSELFVGQMFSRYRKPFCSNFNGPIVITKIEDDRVYYRYTGRNPFPSEKAIEDFMYGVFLSDRDPHAYQGTER